MRGRRLTLEGQRFDRLVVRKFAGSINRNALFECVCDCGGNCVVRGAELRRGKTRSCGCLQKENGFANRNARKTHGEAGINRTSEYMIWVEMKARCLNPNHHAYEYYGGRGITVCDRWLADYQNFLTDVGRRPSATHSIDRINNNGNYEPSNAQWATKKEQSRNRRKRKDSK